MASKKHNNAFLGSLKKLIYRQSMHPLRVSFDTNTYSPVVNPQLSKIVRTGWWPLTSDRILSKKRRIVWWYIRWCIRRGRLQAVIPEAAFAAEVLPNIDRINFLLAIGTPAAANPPSVPKVRRELIDKAFAFGFRVLHGGRIGYGQIIDVESDQWALDDRINIKDRQNRLSDFTRHFSDFSLEGLRDLGEKLSSIHGLATLHAAKANAADMNKITLDRLLWREGLAAEKANPLQHPSREAFEIVVRHGLADWADFDMVGTHYSYGYDYLCSEDTGKPRSKSIFGAAYASDVSGIFGVKRVSLMDLGTMCWRKFKFPVLKW